MQGDCGAFIGLSRAWKTIDRSSRGQPMNSILIVVAVAAAIVAGVWVKVWQCGEMFPNASLVACVLWK
jgi:hypothetical protein